MRPSGRPGELFDAFSRITARAFADDRLLSCPNLSKAPNYGDILRRFLTREAYPPLGSGEWVRLAARYILTNGGQFCFLLLIRLFLTLLRWKAPWPVNGGGERAPSPPDRNAGKTRPPGQEGKDAAVILDTFALLPALAQSGRFQDGYLPGLADACRKKDLPPIHLYRLYGSRNPRILWKGLAVLAAEGPGLTEIHLFTWTDWLRLLRHLCAYPLALFRLIRSLDASDAENPESWVRAALIRTAGQNILGGEARRLAGLRMGLALAAHDAPARLISWYENQTVDKALHRGLSQAEALTGRHLPSLGAQLFIWPDTLLNNHPDDGEAALGLTPDRILVNGPFFLPENTRQEYATGPSLRYSHLFAPLRAANGKAELPLLVLLSYHPEESARVLRLILPLALKGQALLYKFHPAVRIADFAHLLPPDPACTGGGLAQALEKSGAVIGGGSGSLAEAAAVGLPVLSVEDASGIPGLSLNYLPPFGRGQIWEAVRRAEDIEPALGRLRAYESDPARPELVAAFRDLLFSAPMPEAVETAFFRTSPLPGQRARANNYSTL